MIVYTFDPITRKPAGQSLAQICPRTGAELRPPHSFDAPPPVYPECIVVKAGQAGWIVDLEESKTSALAQVDKLHAEALRDLTGKAMPEERDTWAPKALSAQALIDGKATPSQAAMIGLEAQAKGITPEEMAKRVLKNAAQFEMLCGLAAAFKVKSRAAISSAQDVSTLVEVLLSLKAEMQRDMASVTA